MRLGRCVSLYEAWNELYLTPSAELTVPHLWAHCTMHSLSARHFQHFILRTCGVEVCLNVSLCMVHRYAQLERIKASTLSLSPSSPPSTPQVSSIRYGLNTVAYDHPHTQKCHPVKPRDKTAFEASQEGKLQRPLRSEGLQVHLGRN